MEEHRRLIRLLTDIGIEFVVVGGVAAIAHGSALVTYDLDIVARLDHEVNRRIIEALEPYKPRYRMRPDKPRLTPDHHWLATMKNLYLTTTIGQIDVLGELPDLGSYDEIAARAATMEIAGVPCRVLDLDTLIDSKRKANRPKDRRAVGELETIRKLRASENEESG